MSLLKGKRALVTGATAGIGRQIALTYAQQGAHVAIIGTNASRGQEFLQELTASFPEQSFFFRAIDLANHAQTQEAVRSLAEEMGGVEILVNNAGITRDTLLMKMGEEDWDAVLDTNLKSVYTVCQTLIRGMLKARYGKIINISSVVGIVGNAGQTNYAASKAGMIGFTKALALEVASRGICVNCIAPGFIQTKMTDSLTEGQKEALLGKIPMGRFGECQDIAETALFLAQAGYITGQVLTVDGGMVM